VGVRLWHRWRRIAHRAAEIQALVILGALYWLVVVPAGLLIRRRREGRATAVWTRRVHANATTADDARRQF